MVKRFSTCNLCNLEKIRKMAGERGLEVTVTPDNNVYVHNGEVDINKLGPVARTPYWQARFVAIPVVCMCHLAPKREGEGR